MSRLHEHLTNFFLNKISWLLIAFNSILIVLAGTDKGWDFQSFHFYYEPLSYKLFSLLNLPAFICAGLFTTITQGPTPQRSSTVYLTNYELVASASFSIVQWLIIGYLIQFLRRNADADLPAK